MRIISCISDMLRYRRSKINVKGLTMEEFMRMISKPDDRDRLIRSLDKNDAKILLSHCKDWIKCYPRGSVMRSTLTTFATKIKRKAL